MARNLTQLDEYIPPELIALTHRTVTPEEFEQLCADYRDLRLELTSTGELIVMSGTSLRTGRRNAHLTSQLMVWTEKDATGVCFDSSAMFALLNNARRSPDASWVRGEKWDSLSESQKDSFAPICPDFVVELRSKSDRLPALFNKMSEYIENGASLGWLIDPHKRQVYVYRPDHEVLLLNNPEMVSGDPLLPGFKLNLTKLWSD
ncbi:MAG TPA: Uma2 family endonuclease [Pyrinomonadaceae bacterium]|nr:Uma2 family endonuclease [Pyrinomonadaceae bacterium]